jgi:hypothetical protein
MTAFRFIFPDDDDEGFEVLEEATPETAENEEEDEELAESEDDVIWETEED